MNGRNLAFLSILAIGIFLVSCNRQAEPVNAQTPAKIQQWEYKIVLDSDLINTGKGNKPEQWAKHTEDELNKLASEGWEYIPFPSRSVEMIGLVFKRAKR